MTTTKPVQNAFTTVRKPDPNAKIIPQRKLEKDQYFDASGRVVRGPLNYGQAKRMNAPYMSEKLTEEQRLKNHDTYCRIRGAKK